MKKNLLINQMSCMERSYEKKTPKKSARNTKPQRGKYTFKSFCF